MIRTRRLTADLLNAWLVSHRLTTDHDRYRLRLWREHGAALDAIRDELVAYIDEALDDARKRIRRGFEDDLAPFRDPPNDPAVNYPASLHRVTLQGYFGETLAVLAVEHWGAHGHTDWVVPACLFRFHDVEFEHLEDINQRLAAGELYEPDQVAEQRPGRTGDDALAFRRNGEGTITHVLTLEAKCLSEHKNAKIKDAHQKLAAGKKLPSGVRELINLLEDYDSPEARAWQESLLELWRSGYREAVRLDGIAYACGRTPRDGRLTWMSADGPHPDYTVERGLEGLEFHFEDLNAVIETLYRRGPHAE